MLVLTRRPQESIRIGADITVTIMRVDEGKVRVGIAAPRDVTVDRAEIRARKDAGLPPPPIR